MRWVCPNCGQGVSLGLDVCPSCQAGVPPEQRHKTVLPPPPSPQARRAPAMESTEETGVRAFFARTYIIFIGALLAFLLVFFLWFLLAQQQ